MAAIIGAVSVLVLLVVLVASGGSGDATVGAPEVGLSSVWMNLGLGALGGLTLLVWLGLLVAAVSGRHRGPSESPSRVIPGMLLAAALLWILFTVWEPSEREVVLEPPPVAPTTVAPAIPETVAGEGDGSALETIWLVVGAGAVLAAAGAMAWSARRRLGPPEPAADEVDQRRDQLVSLLDDTLADLRDHPDPREAVIAAWARMERAMAAANVPRRASDTPSRFMARVLATVDTSADAVEGFTQVFERAMFSPADISAADQAEAVDVLSALRDELRDRSELARTGAP